MYARVPCPLLPTSGLAHSVSPRQPADKCQAIFNCFMHRNSPRSLCFPKSHKSLSTVLPRLLIVDLALCSARPWTASTAQASPGQPRHSPLQAVSNVTLVIGQADRSGNGRPILNSTGQDPAISLQHSLPAHGLGFQPSEGGTFQLLSEGVRG